MIFTINRDEIDSMNNVKSTNKYKRPKVLRNTTHKCRTGCGNLYVTITIDEHGNPVEIFLTMGHVGGCIGSFMAMIARLSSTMLRYGISIEEVLDKVRDEQCPNSSQENYSCSEALAHAIETFMEMQNDTKERIKTLPPI